MATSLESKATDLAADIGKLGATALRIKEERDDLAKALRDSQVALENILAYLARHQRLLPPLSMTGTELQIERNHAALARVQS